jgi:uncharacterized protein (TIGR02145 family)
MKTIINSSRRINSAWLNTSIAILTCLIFMILPSCQKDSGSVIDQESIKGLDMKLYSSSLSNPTVIYEHRFTRTTGAPVVVTQTLNFDFSQFEDILVLKIQNGSDKKTRVSSAEIRIDGELVAGPSDFSKNASFITRQISGLYSGSILEVKLNSAPGSFINLWIEGTLIALPPTLNPTSIICFTSTTASVSGDITSDGGSEVTARGVCWSTLTVPTTANSKTSDGTGIGIFTSELTGLAGGTTYYVRAYATNSGGTAYGSEVSFTTVPSSFPNCGTMTDFDGNLYNTVIIGTQCWMKENLKTTHFADGSQIPDGTGIVTMGHLDWQYYFNYDNNPANSDIYGRLYTWAAAMKGAGSSNSIPSGVQGVCPNGWHLPSNAEWQILVDELGGSSIAGGKMKEACTIHWADPNTGADNSSNFTALPVGYYSGNITYGALGQHEHFWSSTQNASDKSYNRVLFYNLSTVQTYVYSKTNGLSIRCIKN